MLTLTDGGLETTLLFDEGLELPCFAAFPLLESAEGRDALRRYFEPYLAIARELGTGFVLDTATWRANPDWGAQLGHDVERLTEANRDAVAFARELAGDDADVVVNGVIGPRGDGYVVGESMSADDAATYHGWQIGVFADAGADKVTGVTMTYPDEAIGIVRAASARDLPVVASFTVETDGRLPDGTALGQAIERVDAATDGAAEFFMVNCAHPTHIARGLDGSPALDRIGGLRVNGSAMSHEELDAAEELHADEPDALGRDHAALHSSLPSVQLLGGCCGTNHRHVAAIARAWPARGTV